jgi:hypothetical protein
MDVTVFVKGIEADIATAMYVYTEGAPPAGYAITYVNVGATAMGHAVLAAFTSGRQVTLTIQAGNIVRVRING